MSTTSDSPAARPPEEEEDVPFSGFDEIENAFNRVSIVADSLLETIHDDSLRAKERERQRRRKQKRDNNSSRHRSGKSPSYYSDSSVDDDLTDYNNNTAARHSASKSNNSNRDSNMKTSPHTVTTTSSSHHHHHVDEVVHRNVVSPYDAYTSSAGYEDQDTTSPYTPNYYHDDDVSLLGDSVLGVDEHSLDGSLVQDVHNLKSLQKAMQADLMKAGEIFEANVTPTTEKFNKSFFQKLEAAADHDQNGKTPKTHNLNLKPLASIDIHRRGGGSRSKQKHLQQQQQQQPPQPPFFEQLREFIVSLLGDKPSLPLFVVNVFVWIVVFKMAFAAKQYLVGGDGQLASPVALAMTS